MIGLLEVGDMHLACSHDMMESFRSTETEAEEKYCGEDGFIYVQAMQSKSPHFQKPTSYPCIYLHTSLTLTRTSRLLALLDGRYACTPPTSNISPQVIPQSRIRRGHHHPAQQLAAACRTVLLCLTKCIYHVRARVRIYFPYILTPLVLSGLRPSRVVHSGSPLG